MSKRRSPNSKTLPLACVLLMLGAALLGWVTGCSQAAEDVSTSESGATPQVQRLIDQLHDDDFGVRRDAADALGELGDPAALDPLIDALGDESIHVRSAAAEALGKIGDPAAVEPLIDALTSGRVTGSAAIALGNLGDPRAVDALIVALESGSEYTQEMAATALGKIGDPSAVDALVVALSYWRAGDEAANALARIGGSEACDALIASLETGNWDAAYALGEMGDPSAVDALIVALETGNDTMRDKAARALGEIGDAQAVEALMAAFQDERSDVQMQSAIATALGQIGDPSAAGLLIGTLKTTDSDGLRTVIAGAVNNMGSSAVSELTAALSGATNETAVYNVAEALVMIGDPDTEQPLISALNRWGSKKLVALLQSCGNSTLDAAVSDWEKATGTRVVSGGYDFPSWGELED